MATSLAKMLSQMTGIVPDGDEPHTCCTKALYMTQLWSQGGSHREARRRRAALQATGQSGDESGEAEESDDESGSEQGDSQEDDGSPSAEAGRHATAAEHSPSVGVLASLLP